MTDAFHQRGFPGMLGRQVCQGESMQALEPSKPRAEFSCNLLTMVSSKYIFSAFLCPSPNTHPRKWK